MNSCNWYDPSCSLQWLKNEFHAFALWVWHQILNGLAYLLESIPAPGFLLNIQPVQLDPMIVYLAGPFQLEYGIGIIVTAYTLRFLIRRIPIIG